MVEKEVKSWTSIIIIVFLLLTVCAYFAYQSGDKNGLKREQKELEAQLKEKDRQIDSIAKLNVLLAAKDDSIAIRIDTMQRRYDLIKDLLLLNNEELKRVKLRYKQVERINTFNADSLTRYFKENFDTTHSQ